MFDCAFAGAQEGDIEQKRSSTALREGPYEFDFRWDRSADIGATMTKQIYNIYYEYQRGHVFSIFCLCLLNEDD